MRACKKTKETHYVLLTCCIYDITLHHVSSESTDAPAFRYHGRKHRYTVHAVHTNEQNTGCPAGNTSTTTTGKPRTRLNLAHDYGILPSGPPTAMIKKIQELSKINILEPQSFQASMPRSLQVPAAKCLGGIREAQWKFLDISKDFHHFLINLHPTR